MSWREQAACRGGVSPGAFYTAEPSVEAVEACAGCSVRGPCLAEEAALGLPPEEVVGYRAGLTAAQRRAVYAKSPAHPVRDLHAARLRRVVTAVRGGVRVGDIADAEGVSRRTVSRWLRQARVEGREAG